MRHTKILAALSLLATVLFPLGGQAAPADTIPPSPESPDTSYSEADLEKLVPKARPEDVASPEALTKAIHEAVSGGMGPWDDKRLRSLCVPWAQFSYAAVDADGVLRMKSLSMDSVVEIFKEQHQISSWYEIASNVHPVTITRTDVDQQISMVTYSGREGVTPQPPAPFGAPPTASTEVMRIGSRWYCVVHSW